MSSTIRKSVKLLALSATIAAGVAATSASAMTVLDVTGVSTAAEFDTYSFTIDDASTPYGATLSDFGFPSAFSFLAAAVTKGGALLGSTYTPGSFIFLPTSAGTYHALVYGVPGGFGPFTASSYNLSVSAVPEAETWAMMIVGLGLVGMMRLRRSGTR